MRRTHNGAPTHKSTGSACLDLFAFAGAARNHEAQLMQAFGRAYQENAALALRIALWVRDARGGAGERKAFRHILHWLEKRHPQVALRLVESGMIHELGRWDDYLGVSTPALWSAVTDQVSGALAAKDRLAAKWMPRKGPVAARLSQAMGVTLGEWRKTLVAFSDTVEQSMQQGRWSEIRYSQVPSVAASRYQRAFKNRDGARYAEYLAAVAEGRATMHAGAVFPHDVLRAAAANDEAATVQWSQLPRPAVTGRALVLSDVSGSMIRKASGSVSAMDISVALGLLISECQPEPFRDKVLTFSEDSRFHTVTGDSLFARAENLRGADWGGSTNFQSTFDEILRLARTAPDGFVMPDALIVLSDMEFNQAERRHKTNFEVAQRKFAEAGFLLPKVIFWNLCGRLGNIPAAPNENVLLVSGFSAKLAELVLSHGAALDAAQLMLTTVSSDRYTIPGLT